MDRPRPIEDDFAEGPRPEWVRLILGHGAIEHEPGRIRFLLNPSPARYISDAQIHDYYGRGGEGFPWYPPLHMLVRARFSHTEIVGTAGFGFWNNPFTLHGEVVAAPNNVWFFYASPPSDMHLLPEIPGWGWKAAVLDGGRVPGPAMAVAQRLLRFPSLVRPLGRLARTRVRAAEALLPHPLTEWRTYELRWTARGCTFWVEGEVVLETTCSPTPPLGFVAWVDNQYAVARPDGEIAFGRLEVPQRQWLELERVEIRPLGEE